MRAAKDAGANQGRIGRYYVSQRTKASCSADVAASFGVFCGSWEPRSLEWSKAHLTLRDAIVLEFGTAASPEKVANLAATGRRLEEAGTTMRRLQLETVFNVDVNVNKIVEEIRRRDIKQIASIFIDATSLPRLYLLNLVHRLLKQCICARVVVGYAAGNHVGEIGERGVPILTSGKWTLGSVATGRSTVSADAKGVLAVLLGAETDRTVDLIREVEPHELRLLIPAQAAATDIDRESRRCATLLRGDGSISRQDEVVVRPYDLLAGLRAIVGWHDELAPGDRLTFCGLGPKPLCLAGLLLHLAGREIDVITRIPAGYNPSPTQASGQYAIYEITNLCHPACRLLGPAGFGVQDLIGG